jgi:hypothetical protein
VLQQKEKGESIIGPLGSRDAAFQFRKTEGCKRLIAIVETLYSLVKTESV